MVFPFVGKEQEEKESPVCNRQNKTYSLEWKENQLKGPAKDYVNKISHFIFSVAVHLPLPTIPLDPFALKSSQKYSYSSYPSFVAGCFDALCVRTCSAGDKRVPTHPPKLVEQDSWPLN